MGQKAKNAGSKKSKVFQPKLANAKSTKPTRGYRVKTFVENDPTTILKQLQYDEKHKKRYAGSSQFRWDENPLITEEDQ